MRVCRKAQCYLRTQAEEIGNDCALLTVTASAWVRAREDSRTYSTKRPEGGNGGVGRAMSEAMSAIELDFCPELSCEL